MKSYLRFMLVAIAAIATSTLSACGTLNLPSAGQTQQQGPWPMSTPQDSMD
jgi:hypothetical protein